MSFSENQQRDALLYHLHRLGARPTPPTPNEAAQSLLLVFNQIQNVPFKWDWVDRPEPGSVAIVYHGPHPSPAAPLPSDGLRYLEPSETLTRHTVTLPHPSDNRNQLNLILEQYDLRYGFLPPDAQHQPVPPDQRVLSRYRRRFRIVSGAPHPGIWYVFWGKDDGGRGPPPAAPQGWESQPVRQYPLPAINDPPHSLAAYLQHSLQQQQHQQYPQQQPPVVQPPTPKQQYANAPPPQQSSAPPFNPAGSPANPSAQPPQQGQQPQPGGPTMTVQQAQQILAHARGLQQKGEQMPPSLSQLFITARGVLLSAAQQHQQQMMQQQQQQQQQAAQQGSQQVQPAPPVNPAAGAGPARMGVGGAPMATMGQPGYPMAAPTPQSQQAAQKSLPGIAAATQPKPASLPPGSPPKPRPGQQQPQVGGAAALLNSMAKPTMPMPPAPPPGQSMPDGAPGAGPGPAGAMAMGLPQEFHEPDLLDRMETVLLAEVRYKQHHAYLDWIFSAWSQAELLEDWASERLAADAPDKAPSSSTKEEDVDGLKVKDVESWTQKRGEEEERRKEEWRRKAEQWEAEGEASVRNHEETVRRITTGAPAPTAADVMVQCS